MQGYIYESQQPMIQLQQDIHKDLPKKPTYFKAL